jgi:bacterioferritin
MDQPQFVALLNEDLGLEYRSLVQYIQHLSTFKGLAAQTVRQELRGHVTQKLAHALTLAEQIAFLGGLPTVVIPSVASEPNMDRGLHLELEQEQARLERYRERVEQALALSLPDVAEALRSVLTQTQAHVRDLQSTLGR